jgi:hypothetical protein
MKKFKFNIKVQVEIMQILIPNGQLAGSWYCRLATHTVMYLYISAVIRELSNRKYHI